MTEAKKRSWIRRLWLAISLRLKTRKQLLKAFIEAESLLNSGVLELAKNCKELRQDVFYVITTGPDSTPEEMEYLREVWDRAGEQINWTLPSVLIINKPLEELSRENIEALAEKFGGKVKWEKN